MLERYLLSTLASKFGHVFEDFDENTTAELSAWRGVLALRNLHLRKDALKHLGVPLAGGGDGADDDDEEEEDDDFREHGSDGEAQARAPDADDNNDGEASDDDSFRSCASQLDDDASHASYQDILGEQGNESEREKPPTNIAVPPKRNCPTIEVVHGYIGSLELHIPWGLLRATNVAPASSTPQTKGTEDGKGGSETRDLEDDSLKCSVVLSDVRILLAANNHSRNQSGNQGHNNVSDSKAEKKGSSSRKKSKLQEQERIQKERELAVQALLERELFRLVRGSDGPRGGDSTGEGGDSTGDRVNAGATGNPSDNWLARWAKGLVARVLSSLQVTVQNIHVRYEDEGHGWFEDTSEKRHRYRPAFAVGMRLGHFSIRSATADEELPAGSLDGSKDTDSSLQSRHKIANVEGLSVYWDSSHSDLFVGYTSPEDDREYYDKRFAELDIMTADEFEGGALHHSYLIRPISPSLQLMATDSDASPSIHANLCLPSCHINFDRNTLEDIAYVRKCLSAYKARIISSKEHLMEQRIAQQLQELRPSTGIRPCDSPRLWWKYAFRAVRALQSDHGYFEGKTDAKKRRWRRDGWLGLARLLRLRNEYTSLYQSFWDSSQSDLESKKKIHDELMSLEGNLNNEEIAAFRMAVYTKLSEVARPDCLIETSDTRAPESLEFDELAQGSISVISLEYREAKLNQIIQSIQSDQGEFHSTGWDSKSHSDHNVEVDSDKDVGAPMLVVTMDCQDFTLQANDTPYSNNALDNIIARPPQIQQTVPIVRLQCMSSLKYNKFSNGSWDLSCALNALTVSDLISPCDDKSCEGRVLIGRKLLDDDSTTTCHSNEHTAKIVIRNLDSDDNMQGQATTYFNVDVSPLEVIYSTIAFEALSRLFAAVKTTEFNRDLGRITQALSRWKSKQSKRLMSVLARRKKIIASIDISAPVFYIPEDLQNTNSPTFVVDLGRLTFKSDFGDHPPLGFDDKWLLQVESIKALCIHTKSHALIEPFSLKFSILTHIAEDALSDATKIDVQALLPQLSFNLTTSAVRLVTRLQMSWDDAKSSKATQIPHKQTLDDILMANTASPHHHTGHTELFNDLGKEELSVVDEVKVVQEIKFSFSAPKVALQIGNDVRFDQCTTDLVSNLIPLINLSIQGIRGNYVTHSSEAGVSSQLNACLHSIHAMDIEKSGSHFCHFISSVDPGLLQDYDLAPDMDNDEDDDLVAVEMSKIQTGEKEISVRFHELYVEWNPELLSRVQKSLRLSPSPQISKSHSVNNGSDADISNQTSTESSEFFDAIDNTNNFKSVESDEKGVLRETEDDKTPGDMTTPSPGLKISFHLSKLRVNFNKDSQHRCLFSAEMNETDISYRLKPMGGSITTANVANARINDPEGMTGGTLYGQLIGLQSGGSNLSQSSIVRMSFETFTSHNSNEPEFHNLMKVDFSKGMKFVYLHQLWMEIFDYFFEGILGHAVWGTRPKPSAHFFNPSDATRKFKRTRMNIKMNQPLLLLPVCYRSPHHIRLKMNDLSVASHFSKEQMNKKEGKFTNWIQWFHNCTLNMNALGIQSWDERKLNDIPGDAVPPSLTINIRWPVGPTAPLIKPKWNVSGKMDPIVLILSRKHFSLFRFFVNCNLLEASRFLTMHSTSSACSMQGTLQERLVLYGYEKTGVPPTTYSIKFSSDLLQFQFLLDEEESASKRVEGIMNVNASMASWSLIKHADCISKQRAHVDSICLTQTSDKHVWSGFPDLLLPIPMDASVPRHHCLFQFTSTTYPSGDNVKTIHLDAAGIYLIVPAWQHVGSFFQNLLASPEIFEPEEMSSIMQVGDRFYRMTKSTGPAKKREGDAPTVAEVNNAPLPHQVSIQKQLLVTLTSPRIMLVADATNRQSDCLSLSMAHLNLLRQTNTSKEVHSVFCDGLEFFTGMTRNLAPQDSLLCPVSISGSLTKALQTKLLPQQISGWVWAEELQARASYTDLTYAIDVFDGVKKQTMSPQCKEKRGNPTNLAQMTKSSSSSDTEEKEEPSPGTINIEALCNGFNLIVTDNSHRHFANTQPLIAVRLTGMRYSRVVNSNSRRNTFVSLDSLELTDLLRHGDSPFRVMATSSNVDHSTCGLFSFQKQIELDTMSWQSHHMVAFDWGYQMSSLMQKRQDAISHLTPPNFYFDKSLRQHQPLVAFQSVICDSGLHRIDVHVQHLTAQWNPSNIVACQRFLGRLKKATLSILGSRTGSANTTNKSASGPPSKEEASSNIIFSVNAELESLCICLNKEYQQRRLLDVTVTGVKTHFERYNEHSLLLRGSVENCRAWDPDMSKDTSDRNRHLLSLTNDENGKRRTEPFFSFQYRTFRTPSNRPGMQFSLPDWVEDKIKSGTIDDFLSVRMRPLLFNHLSERTAELADYLKHGLPGKGMGATSKAAQSFCASRIRTRSFLDLVIDQPRVFVPRSASSITGGCYLSLGTVAITSWFEEAIACPNPNKSRHVDEYRIVGDHSLSEDDQNEHEMDWWRVLHFRLCIGIKIEVDQPFAKDMSNPDTFFHTNLSIRTPTLGTTTIIQGNAPSLNICLKYREFMVLNLIVLENIGKPIHEEEWDNIEKSYWSDKDDSLADVSNDQHDSSLMYAESARLVRFGEGKPASSKKSSINFGFLIDSINVTLHRDDWFENLDEENAALLCYDVCKFSIHKMDVAIESQYNGDKTVSIALYDMSFTDVGDYGRLARDIYLGSNDFNRPPCAFSVVAEAYGVSEGDPLVSLIIGTQTSKTNEGGNRKRVKNVELKVNSLSVTVLPRSIDDVVCFLSKRWNCPNLEMPSVLLSPNSAKKFTEESASSTDTLRFKFVAIYPRLILLADESDPFSRALVLRGLAVGNLSINHEEASSVFRYEQIDRRSTTSLSGHVKELETYVHNNIDVLINPDCSETVNLMGVALLEPVTVTMEARLVSRTRFPTSRFVSIEVEPVSLMLSFGDLNLIDTVLRKSTRKKKEKMSNESKPFKNERRGQSTTMTTQVDSLQFSKSSDYSEEDTPLTYDVAILTKKLGLQLRRSGSSVVVDSSIINTNIEPGDILTSINSQSVERMPLPSIVELFERTPRPLTITLLRRSNLSSSEHKHLQHQSSVVNGSNTTTSHSLSFDMSFNPFDSPSENAANGADKNEDVTPSQAGTSSQVVRFDLICGCGIPNGLSVETGLGGKAVVDNIDYDLLLRCSQPNTDNFDLEYLSGIIASKKLPLPGAIVLAVDEKELTFEEMHGQLLSNEASVSRDKSYTLSFVQADAAAWGNVTKFEGKLSFVLTVIDDTNGRDMPVLRAGLKETSFAANHGLAVATKSIDARQPLLLSFSQNEEGSDSVLTLDSEISSFSLEYNNAIINQWEPIIEPHSLRASVERQSGNVLQPGKCSIVISDQKENSSPGPLDFICVNVSDSAADILSKATLNWRQWKGLKSQTRGPNGMPMSPSATPKQAPLSPVFGTKHGSPSTSSASDLKKATKLAKLALDFSRKRGQTAQTDIVKRAPFILRNRSGMRVSCSGNGISASVIENSHDAQLEMSAVNAPENMDGSENSHRQNGRRVRKYDGKFPAIDIELGFDSLGTTCDLAKEACRDVFADPITDLPTDRVDEYICSVRLWKKNKNGLSSQYVDVVWSVELVENRRVLTLSSATNVKAFGCGPAIEVGVRFSNDEHLSDAITAIGTTGSNNMFHLPLWVQSCFCQIDVFIRPFTQAVGTRRESNVYSWSNFPVLSNLPEKWNADAIEVHYNWATEIANTLGGVSCPLSSLAEVQKTYHPVWLECTYSKNDRKGENVRPLLSNSGCIENNASKTTVTIWSALSIRNMLPCNVEWEVASSVKEDGTYSIFDSSSKRTQQRNLQLGSSEESMPSDLCSPLKCGSAVEIFPTDASHNREVHARFKCVACNGPYWSEWLCIGVSDSSMKKSFGGPLCSNQINLVCKNSSCDNIIGVKLSPRTTDAGKGVNISLYAELWLRNLTLLPLTFGAPQIQLGSDGDPKSSLPGKVSAESALIELTSVLEGNSFGLFGSDDDDDDLGGDILNLPLQQCEEVFEEVFEYLSLGEKGSVERRWFGSENHFSLRQEPKTDAINKENAYTWLVDCAGEPLLQNGWESCANIAGSKSLTFNGQRLFNKSHRFRRRRWFRKVSTRGQGINNNDSDMSARVIFHQPSDLTASLRSKREAERNAIGVHLDGREKDDTGQNLLDVFYRPPQKEGVLDIMTKVANDGSILIHVKHNDGKWSTPAIIPPSGSSTGVIRVCSSRWPLVTKTIKGKGQKPKHAQAAWGISDGELGMAPLEPSVFELIYQVTLLSGLWGELSRMMTIMPRFLIRNESSWLDIDVKQVGAPDASRVLIKKGEVIPFYWFDTMLPELVCTRPTQSRNRFKWTGGFDLCTLGMIPLRVRRIDGSMDQLNLRSMRVNVELQPGTGGSGTMVSIRDEDPYGEGSLFRIENHSPFGVFVSQDGILANPASVLQRNDTSLSCDLIQPGERTSYALDVPWRQGKYSGRTSASMSELLLLRCALAPLSTRDGVESTKVVCFARVGEFIRLSPSKLSSLSSITATELLGVRVLGIVGTDGPTRTLRFILMQKEVTTSGYIGNAMRETISPMPSFMSVETAPHNDDGEAHRGNALLNAVNNASKLLNSGSLPNEREAAKQAFFGTGSCRRSSLLERSVKAHSNLQEGTDRGDDISCELSFSGFIFSIIDSSPTELAVLSLHNMRIEASWNSAGKEYARSRIVVGWVQIDNHCPNSAYPVAMRPRIKANENAKPAKEAFSADRPFLELMVDLAPSHRTGIKSLAAGASLHDVEIFLDLAFILRMQRFLLGLHDHIMVAAGNAARAFVDSQETWEIPDIEKFIGQKTGKTIREAQSVMYFKRLTILPCKVKLSVAPVRALTKHQEEFEGKDASAIHAAVRKGDVLVGEGSGVLGVKLGSKNRTAISVVQGMLKSILVDAFLRLDGASLNFEGVALFNHTSNSPQLVTYLGAHYLASLIANVPSLIGSLAAFGNPLGLIRDIGDGVSDFVNEPVKGFKKSIEEMDPSFVMSGVARGTGSLARHTVGGFADSAAMLTETAAKNMAVLTLDRKYAQRRDRVMKLKANDSKAATILEGLESGMIKLVDGIMEGVTGVVSKPIRGAERSGFEGFAKGVGKGLLGLLVKPVIGTTDLLTDTLMGVKGSVEGAVPEGMLTLYSQVRPRRALYGRDRAIKPYRIDDATAATIQSKLCIGGEEYLSHVDMIKRVALMSVRQLLILSGDGEELLLLPLNKIEKVEVWPQIDTEQFIVKIFLNEPKANGSETEEVKCDDEKMANLLCRKLTEAVSQQIE